MKLNVAATPQNLMEIPDSDLSIFSSSLGAAFKRENASSACSRQDYLATMPKLPRQPWRTTLGHPTAIADIFRETA